MSELDEIFPVARIKVFTGEYKLYTDMSELDKEIKEVDVYSKEQVLKLLEPQLTIPKSIADELDDIFNGFVKERYSRSIWNLLWRAEEIDDEIGMQLSKLLPDVNQENIAVAYLAGKALGVNLVKVVEG